ncbi:nitrite reductase/ring-hydroxylating ferredoxin subunit [Lentzea atacamensis]|uniref:Cytochrome bc1 complex Rieske iron-sulfur subunit n=1 Tax=Lentzea atacamensis TaxID=531938 RepID=A0ABX9EHC9_9PSEU|nr:Rieske (2Fe-2S) protein [Lentzea atacamensis]RAS70581.1 nitrite reductase/ring-hydroxylating ferredoxin subunit [Lentzea atacamensis]
MEFPDHPTTVSRRCFIGGCAAAATVITTGTAAAADTETDTGAQPCGKLPPGTVLAKKADVPLNGGVVVYFDDETSVVVAQPKKGTYTAFDAKCTHAGCMCSEVDNNLIICWCHDSRFSSVDGKRRSGPAKKPLPQIKTKIKGENIVVA